MNETTRSNNGRYSVQIERWLDHPVERVWRAITERDQLSRWYPMSVTELDLRVGGRITVDDGEGTVYRGLVQELDPPRVFSITEVDDLLHIQLEPDGDGCHLIFRHTFDDPSIMESVETGWNECLNALEEILAGRERA